MTPASVTALVVPAGLLTLPPVAQAATSPTVSSFGAVAGDPGILRVAATSDTPIAPVTATLTPFQGTGAAATVTTFESVHGHREDELEGTVHQEHHREEGRLLVPGVVDAERP